MDLPMSFEVAQYGGDDAVVDPVAHPIDDPVVHYKSELLHLPRETIRSIISFIPLPLASEASFDAGEHVVSRRTLCSLSLTCEALCDLSQERLYSTVSVDNAKIFGLLLRSVTERSALPLLIKQLYIGYFATDEYSCEIGLRAFDASSVDFSRSPLAMLEMVYRCGTYDAKTTIQHLVGFLLAAASRLERLVFAFKRSWAVKTVKQSTEVFFSDILPSVVNVVNLFERLRELEFRSDTRQRYDNANVSVSPFFVPTLLKASNLKTLRIPCDNGNWRFFDRIRPHQHFALENIALNGSSTSGSNLSRLLCRCPKLKSLVVVLDFHVSRWETFWIGTEQARISDILPVYCPKLHTLSLQLRRFGGFFVADEACFQRFVDMKELAVLRVDLPVLFKDANDMHHAYLQARLPPGLMELELYDVWTEDGRLQREYTIQGDSDLVLVSHERVDASAEPLTVMLRRLAAVAPHHLPRLRSVRVKSVIYDHDSGQTANQLAAVFDSVGVEFEVISSHDGKDCPLEFGGALSAMDRLAI
ncbi:hypothetical protein CSHISOI_01447 [Colletotrichum shisoi]|uniref:F-box domain-containing protein n=1 Tax=Colletotrichum shisoi TaxID=2078593 RepID=A0A5Q4C3P7_9PEZI|nr:hypothetical protein CSHISOI_01447 [Colletotrichum shisoi]